MGRTKFPTQTQTPNAARQITSYVNKATDANAASLWHKLHPKIATLTESAPLGVADSLAVAIIRQHGIFAERRPSKARLGTRQPDNHPGNDPGVRNSSASAAQMGVLRHLLQQVGNFKPALKQWMTVFLELEQSTLHGFLTQGRFGLCLLGAALDEDCLFHGIPMPVVCKILGHAGWAPKQSSSEHMIELLQQHQAENWLSPWHTSVHMNTFAAVLSQWLSHRLADLDLWVVDVTLPCLLDVAQPRNVYAALLILLGVCQQLYHDLSLIHISEPTRPY
eukprot:TRINITY_DN3634_c0_g1_i3.p1 TRINITY_DN3634_c0_g1~~TRINITY_DN3634_c0_g1_i3.p1  ORF type:complete len:278 (+),score=48.66 TRINITY_DN3634_c0_g1_i3:278-1111(+)